MLLNYDKERLDQALHDFYTATGINIDILKEDFTILEIGRRQANNYCSAIQSCKMGKQECLKSDTKLAQKCSKSKSIEVHVCHAGLIDMAAPLIYDGNIIGYVVLGQMKKDTNFSTAKKYIESLGLGNDKMEAYYNALPLYDQERIKSVANIAEMLTKYILLENMLNPGPNNSLQKAVTYINDNLDKKLSITDISRKANISKSLLYKLFHDKFNCTVIEYVMDRRIERSLKLLEDNTLSIEDISQKLGFSTISYFSRTFKKKMGISPMKFKKSLKM